MGSPPTRWRAPAKVNLTLHILARRADGYHELDSLVVFAGVLALMALLVIWKHRANIARLLAGTEPRIGQKG